MFGRLWRSEGQTRAARSVEYFGYVDFTLGLLLALSGLRLTNAMNFCTERWTLERPREFLTGFAGIAAFVSRVHASARRLRLAGAFLGTDLGNAGGICEEDCRIRAGYRKLRAVPCEFVLGGRGRSSYRRGGSCGRDYEHAAHADVLSAMC